MKNQKKFLSYLMIKKIKHNVLNATTRKEAKIIAEAGKTSS